MKKYLLLPVFLFLFISCNNKVTNEDLELWSNSPVGWEKIEEICNSPEVPLDTKIQALEKLVVKHHIRVMKDILFTNKDRVKISEKLYKRMSDRFAKADNEAKRILKDGFFIIMRYLSSAEKDKLRQIIANWAFKGLSKKDKTEKIKSQIEHRITLHQITMLGKYGIKGALLLVSRGFGIDTMFAFIKKFNRRDFMLQYLDALKKLHKIPNIDIPPSHLNHIVNIGGIEAVEYLIDIYYNNEQEDNLRDDALALAINLMDDKDVAKKGKELIEKLKFVLSKENPENRRLAAHYILKFGGITYLSQVLDAMKDDKTFDSDVFSTKQFIIDFCKDDILSLKGNVKSVLVTKLSSKDRVTRLISLICLKLNDDGSNFLKETKKIVRDKTDLNDLLAEKITFADIAQNIKDSYKFIKALKKALYNKKISSNEYNIKKQLYLDSIDFTGKELKDAVNIKYQAYLNNKKAKPAPAKKAK